MYVTHLILTFLIFFVSGAVFAQRCEDLFARTEPLFKISILKSSETDEYFQRLKDKSIDKKLVRFVRKIIKEIEKDGAKALSKKQVRAIVEFRQDISFLRSAYEILAEHHTSPDEFNRFVKRFGRLKDLVLLKDNRQAKDMAAKLLRMFSPKKINELIDSSQLADQQSILAYVQERLYIVGEVLKKRQRTVDEIHIVRKSLRNIYRYLEIQEDVLELDSRAAANFTLQLNYLKDLNRDLGAICDANAARILQRKMYKEDYYKLPDELYTRVMTFIYGSKIETRGE